MHPDREKLIPRVRWKEVRAVEAPDHLWHLRLDGATLCELEADHWPIVLNATERAGIWCGACLHKIAV
jgi:hypothetical protein